MYLASLALASSLVGNPTLRIPDCDGEPVLNAPVPGLDWKFVSVGGTIQVVHTGACDLAVGCTAQAPFGSWAEVSIHLAPGFKVETELGFTESVGADTLKWTHTGQASAWQGPGADSWMLAMGLTLSQ